MKRPEPLVERHHAIGIIHLEIFVVQVVGKVGRIHTCLFTNNHSVKSRVPLCWGETQTRGKIDHVNWMRRDKKKKENGGKVNLVLYRVHGKARPRPPIGVAVMQLVRHLIQRWPVQQTVRAIEAHLMDKWYQKE